MTPEQYSMFSRLFDSALAVRQNECDSRPSITLHGPLAGAALRYWCTQRELDVEPGTLEDPSLGSWTVLRVAVRAGDLPFLVVHLWDYVRVASSGPSAEAR